MSQPAKGPASSAKVFAPGDIKDDFDWQSGERRKLEPRAAFRLLWPKTRKDQRELFEAWHAIAMQVVTDGRGSYRTIAVIWRFINWRTGSFFPTDATLSRYAGGCSEKSISRDLRQYHDFGIIAVELGWRKDRAGKWRRSRSLYPTVPVDLKAKAGLPLDENHTDSSGPYDLPDGAPDHTDTSGLNHTDSSGPFTLEEPVKRSARSAAA